MFLLFRMTDINAKASQVSMKTMRQNNIPTTDGITTNITAPLVSRLQGQVDILLCNPPYVPTPTQEVSWHWIPLMSDVMTTAGWLLWDSSQLGWRR